MDDEAHSIIYRSSKSCVPFELSQDGKQTGVSYTFTFRIDGLMACLGRTNEEDVIIK
jgi:hypothetical protein